MEKGTKRQSKKKEKDLKRRDTRLEALLLG
jgi:hypothetical protein